LLLILPYFSAFEEEKLASMSQHHALGEALEAARQEASSLAEELVKKSSKFLDFSASCLELRKMFFWD